MKVAVVMGSKSDYPKLEEGISLLERLGEISLRFVIAQNTLILMDQQHIGRM